MCDTIRLLTGNWPDEESRLVLCCAKFWVAKNPEHNGIEQIIRTIDIENIFPIVEK